MIKKILMDSSFAEMTEFVRRSSFQKRPNQVMKKINLKRTPSDDAFELLKRILSHSKFRGYFGQYINYPDTSSLMDKLDESISAAHGRATGSCYRDVTSAFKSVRRRGEKLLGAISQPKSFDSDEMTISGPTNIVRHYHASADEDGKLTGLPANMEQLLEVCAGPVQTQIL